MKGRRLALIGILVALACLMTPFGFLMMRAGPTATWQHMAWVFGVWALVVLIARIAAYRAARQDANPDTRNEP